MKLRVLGALLALVASGAHSQESKPLLPLVWIDSSVRRQLTEAWQRDTVPVPNERAYCVAYTESMYERRREWTVRVLWSPSVMTNVTAHGMDFTCVGPAQTIRVHTHPPTTCTISPTGKDFCFRGGVGAYQCWPSIVDQRTLDLSGEPFSIVQCDKNSLVVYWSTKMLSETSR